MIQNNTMLQAVGLLMMRNAAFEKDLSKKVVSALVTLKLAEAREVASAGASAFYLAAVDRLPVAGLLKFAKKLDPHLPGRDAMPEAWLRTHVKRLIVADAEPAKAVKKVRQPKAANSSVATGRRAKPEKVKVVVNG